MRVPGSGFGGGGLGGFGGLTSGAGLGGGGGRAATPADAPPVTAATDSGVGRSGGLVSPSLSLPASSSAAFLPRSCLGSQFFSAYQNRRVKTAAIRTKKTMLK